MGISLKITKKWAYCKWAYAQICPFKFNKEILIPNFHNMEIRKRKSNFYNSYFCEWSYLHTFLKFLLYCKWAYFWGFQNNGHIANGHIYEKCKIMGILKWAYSICPFLQMGIFFSNGHILPNMPKKKPTGTGGAAYGVYLQAPSRRSDILHNY